MLSNAKIETITAGIVCMMMPGPAQSNNHLSVKRGWDFDSEDFLGEMKLIAGPTGCWVRRKIFPKVDHERIAAENLKETLKFFEHPILPNMREI